jgi:hypothetical protein
MPYHNLGSSYRKIVRKGQGGAGDSIDSYLGRRKQIEGLLISRVCPLQIITHEITMAYERRVIRTRGFCEEEK